MRLEIKRHERIKMQLRLAGSSLTQVARELGVQPSTVASVSRGKSRSRRIEDRIAAVLATAPERLWPDRYSLTPSRPND
ncbi:helix-turn-helix domain-containing protein [Pseudoxanthomonas mexicana]|uniref:helix-turn-helix domain-containing protein n=1 Tax=Pseudoxanthomonas mexicana TaxID=128785 RepID=UPI0022F3CD06|nr:helix-turn-helix domain-containing protein [Pseudoxanthomonas mexicana]WBX94974.1 helix-turn-helix domain-containing protein [Pseudoxanthomonas mexicana]